MSQRRLEDIQFAASMEEDEPKLLEGVEEEPEDEAEGASHDDAPSWEVLLEKNDRSLAELASWEKAGDLIINPEWQRGYVWDRKRASKLIESFLKDIPVPVIYLAKRKDGRYEVIDGLQRLTSVFKYFNNDYGLSPLELLGHLRDKRFKDLPRESQKKL